MTNASAEVKMPRRRSPPGFRFSLVDVLAILIVAASTWLGWPVLGELIWLLPITLFHFFLFCNVFRIHRQYELIWAAVFVMNVMAWTLSGNLNWWYILAVQSPVTLTFIVLEIVSDRYHGILCHRNKPPVEVPNRQATEP